MSESLAEINDRLLALQKAKEEMEQQLGESFNFIDLIKDCTWRIELDAYRSHLVIRDHKGHIHDFYLKFNSLSPRTQWELIHGVDSYEITKRVTINRDRNNPHTIYIAFISPSEMAAFIKDHNLIIDTKDLQQERDRLAKWVDEYDYLITCNFRSDNGK